MSKSNVFLKYLEYSSVIEESESFLKKISGGLKSSLGLKISDIFGHNMHYHDDIERFMENDDNYKDLNLDKSTGYINVLNDTKLPKEKISTWFSKFILGNGKEVGKGEVLLPILYKNVYKTPMGEVDDSEQKETGDLYMSDDGGNNRTGRIEVKSALPGGFKFYDYFHESELKKLNDNGRLLNVWNDYSTKMDFIIDRDLFFEMCTYCIARYMHGQHKNSDNYYLAIFDNKPRVNSKGNIHGSKTDKIKYFIDRDGDKQEIDEYYLYKEDEGNDELEFSNNPFGDEDILSSGPGESTKGNEEIEVNGVEGFLYIKRGKNIEETMKLIMSVLDKDSSVYKENKSNRTNNFTFYVKNKKLCIAHRDNPPLAKKSK